MFWRRKKRSQGAFFKIFYASDVHGSEKLFRKFINAGNYYGVNALIMGGDLTGKKITPIVSRGDGTYVAEFMGRKEQAHTKGEIEKLEKLIRFNGYYPYLCKPDEEAELREGGEHFEQIFEALMRESIERWVELADERLEGSDVQCFVIPGNDDSKSIDAIINRSNSIVNHDSRVVEMDDYQLMGCSISNRTPWDTPRELSEHDLMARLEAASEDLEPGRPWILNTHVPPFDSNLDNAPELTKDLEVVTIAGQPHMISVGSKAVRSFIEKHQPMLSLHGHIHESRGNVHIGNTVAVNAGSEYNIGVLRGALITLQEGEVKHVQLISG